MKKLVIMGLACGLLLSACNGFTNNEDNGPDVFERNKANNNNSAMQTKNNMPQQQQPVKPQRFLDRDITILFEGKRMSIAELARLVDEKLEQENSGLDFFVNVDAEDNNTE